MEIEHGRKGYDGYFFRRISFVVESGVVESEDEFIVESPQRSF